MRESSKWLQKQGAFYKNMARFTKIWREVFKKYYKACRLLFIENTPLGRPWPSIKI
jgi:hypothetical protein